MAKINAFAFTCKSQVSLSGVCIRITPDKKKQEYRLFRQFEGKEKEFIFEFNTEQPRNSIVKIDIKARNRDIFSLIKEVRKKAKTLAPDEEDIFETLKNEDPTKSEVFKLWQKFFVSEKFIKDSYPAYMFVDKLNYIWIYDVVPAVSALSQISKDDLLPIPGTRLTYYLEDADNEKEDFEKTLTVPDILEGKIELFDVFEGDNYLYHLGLYRNNRFLWGKFTTNTKKRRAKFLQETGIMKHDLIANIRPDVSTIPDLKKTSTLFKTVENPPVLSHMELLETNLVVSKIRTDNNSPNEFNNITFASITFNSSDFPRTISFIYPYK